MFSCRFLVSAFRFSFRHKHVFPKVGLWHVLWLPRRQSPGLQEPGQCYSHIR